MSRSKMNYMLAVVHALEARGVAPSDAVRLVRAGRSQVIAAQRYRVPARSAAATLLALREPRRRRTCSCESRPHSHPIVAYAVPNPVGPDNRMLAWGGVAVLAAIGVGFLLIARRASAAPASPAASPSGGQPPALPPSSATSTTLIADTLVQTAFLMGSQFITVWVPYGAYWDSGNEKLGVNQWDATPIELGPGTYSLYWMAADGTHQKTQLTVRS